MAIRVQKTTSVLFRLLLFVCFLCQNCTADSGHNSAGEQTSGVKTGLDMLVADSLRILSGANVGVICNHTGVSSDGRHIVDILAAAHHVNLTAIFATEHGFRGNKPRGVNIAAAVDSATGVPIYSLYGKRKTPSAEMLADVDVLVFDMQDIGARFYTYIYSMARAMQAAAQYNTRFVVLDRPNPITGTHIEGAVLESEYASFVGMFPLPVRHGMTVAELATMFRAEKWIQKADDLQLQVVPMQGWQREMWYDDTGLRWIAPSPSMRTLTTATVYPGNCLFEGTNLSEGRGTDKPFEIVGAPWLKAGELIDRLEVSEPAGIHFEAVSFIPTTIPPSVLAPKYKDQQCQGVRFIVTDRDMYKPVKTAVTFLKILEELQPSRFEWTDFIYKLYGSKKIKSKGMAELWAESEDLDDFISIRDKYLIY